MDVEGQERCSIADLSSGPRPGQKFMSNRIADRAVYLERRMTGFAEALEQAHSISATSSLGVPCQVAACHCVSHNSRLLSLSWGGWTRAGLLDSHLYMHSERFCGITPL